MVSQRPEPRYLAVGRVLRPHGIRGELRAEILTDYPERLIEKQYVYVGPDHRRYALKGARIHQNVLLLQLEGIEDRNTADELRGELIEIVIEDAVPLEEEEYYHFQLEGMQVETDEGEHLGEIVEILSPPGANDIYVVHGARGELLVPAIADVVKEIDLEADRMVIHVIPGLFNTN